jgi:hypothetical protein
MRRGLWAAKKKRPTPPHNPKTRMTKGRPKVKQSNGHLRAVAHPLLTAIYGDTYLTLSVTLTVIEGINGT